MKTNNIQVAAGGIFGLFLAAYVAYKCVEKVPEKEKKEEKEKPTAKKGCLKFNTQKSSKV